VAAHFLMKLMFCMFGEDIGLLPAKIFSRVLEAGKKNPKQLCQRLGELFEKMGTGGYFGADEILWFNGGRFADAEVVELRREEIEELIRVNDYDWANVEPSIFGTLFERTLDPAKRSQIGAHYTSRQDILTLLEPVVMTPLRREWAEVRSKCDKQWEKVRRAAPKSRRRSALPLKPSKALRDFERTLFDFLQRLAHVRILDPACGSGNFLYVAINLLLDLEKEVIAYGASHGVSILPQVRPTQLAGIEINPYAQQLAQVVIWIGYLQWMHHNGFNPPRDPVLEPIESIHLMDAILDLSDPENPKEPEWPEADFIVGNPPFLGDKKMRGELGDNYVNALRHLYKDRLPRQSDVCCYWFEKARAQLEENTARRAGLLATQGIRGGANRRCLERVKATGDIFWAYSDRNWILDGATVHVSMVGFDSGEEDERRLNGECVESIHANLTAGAMVDTGKSRPLRTNTSLCFLGVMKAGPFDVAEATALGMMSLPNPHGRPNSDVLRPRLTARDILQRQVVGWIIDFGCEARPSEVSQYEAPWQYVDAHVRPLRIRNRRKRLAQKWWLHGEPRPGLRGALAGLNRFIVTPEVSKHRVFVWLDCVYLADHQTRAFPRSDDCFLGVLHSRPHEVWARSQGTQLRERESGFRYTPTTCFETFPLPEPADEQESAIAKAAKELDDLRNHWLNPPEWTRREVLEFPGSVDGPWARYIDLDTVRWISSPLPPAGEGGERSEPGEGAKRDKGGGGRVVKTKRPHPQPLSRERERGVGIGTVRYPRIVPKDDECAKELKKRTLTNLYNQRPTWLDLAHKKLDEAVFAAYGWDPSMSDEQILAKLLKLNLERAKEKPTGG